MSRTVTLNSLPRAFAMIKEIERQGYDWGEDYRRAAFSALADARGEVQSAGRGRNPGGGPRNTASDSR